MKRLYLLILLVLLLFPIVAAENGIEIIVKNNSISVRGYTNDPTYGKVDFGFFNKINETMSQSIICDNVTVEVIENNQTYNRTYQQNCSLKINYIKDLPIYSPNESSSSIIGDTQLYQQLIDCQTLKAQYSAGLDSCVKDKGTMTDVGSNYSQCVTDLQLTKGDKTNLESKVDDLEKEMDDHKNSQWWYGLIGLVLGGLVMMIYYGKIGGAKIKGEEESFNPRQSA